MPALNPGRFVASCVKRNLKFVASYVQHNFMASAAVVCISAAILCTSWFWVQAYVILRGFLTFPLTPDQRRTAHFGVSVLIALAAIVFITWFAINHSAWQERLLDYFEVTSEWLRALFRLLFVRTLEDTVVDKTMSVAIEVWAAIVMPPAIIMRNRELDWGQFLLNWMDSKTGWFIYFTSNLMWSGLAMGLYDLPLNTDYKVAIMSLVGSESS
jgi:hypothetical protein